MSKERFEGRVEGYPPDKVIHAPPAVMGKGLTKKSGQVWLPCFHLSPVSFQPYAMLQGRANFFMDDAKGLFYCVVIDSLRYRLMRSRFVPRLENCFSQTSVKRASTLRLICS